MLHRVRPIRIIEAAAVIAALLLAWACIVRAAPPPGTDPASPLARWVHTIHRRSSGVACCSTSDCRPTRVRIGSRGVEAWVGRDQYGANAPDAWVPVPDEVIEDTTADGPAPDGRGAWVCFYGGVVRCAVIGGAG